MGKKTRIYKGNDELELIATSPDDINIHWSKDEASYFILAKTKMSNDENSISIQSFEDYPNMTLPDALSIFRGEAKIEEFEHLRINNAS